MSKRSKKIWAVVGVFLLLLLIAASYFYLSHKYMKDDDLEYDDNAMTGILPGVDIDERRK